MSVGKELWTEFETLSNKHDPAGAAALYTSDGVFVDLTARYQGREAIVAYLEALD
jgi:uncharacterized protein (TIGR02246 family)